MTTAERQRSSRRTLYVALGISAAFHAAAFAFLAMPIRVPAAKAPAVVLLPPLAEPAPVVPIPAAAESQPAASGGGANPSASVRAAVESGTPVEAVTRNAEAVVPASLALATDDSLAVVDALPGATADEAPVETVVAVADGPHAAAAAAAEAYTPGSVGNAKARWAGTTNGASASPSAGRGIGITIGGPKRHPARGPKRHPPRGNPGRGGGVFW
jgi:hypothetical protein